MRSLRCSLLLLPFLAIWVSPLFAQTEEAARLLHAWGRFGEGSWTRVRVTNETIDANGNSVTTTTETTTTLSELGQDGYTLRVEVQVEVAGQTLSPKPQFITRGYNGEVEGQTVSVKSIGTGEIRIDNQSIPCELQQVTIDRGDTKVTSSVHVARDIHAVYFETKYRNNGRCGSIDKPGNQCRSPGSESTVSCARPVTSHRSNQDRSKQPVRQ